MEEVRDRRHYGQNNPRNLNLEHCDPPPVSSDDSPCTKAAGAAGWAGGAAGICCIGICCIGWPPIIIIGCCG
uniref:Uncharacterized protein n=1 Tax=Anopheles minimus TaxID=112268 RepID=A0A182WKB3_9DIPT